MARSSLSLHILIVIIVVTAAISVTANPFVDKEVARRLAIEELTSRTSESCKQRSGLCVDMGQCPQGKLAEIDDLCGASQQCCHSLPSDGIYDCEERTGICRPEGECKGAPRDEGGRCREGHVCCVLVF